MVREPLAAVTSTAKVLLDGAAVSLVAPTRALMLHKPEGLVTAGFDPEGRGTVFEHLYQQLPDQLQRYEWVAIGRLDRDTTGLLLFTNDERLVAHVAHPRTHLEKRYVARVRGEPTPHALETLRGGVLLDDRPTRPAGAALRDRCTVELTITEGRKHQVKRMLEAVGFPVEALHREAVGGVALDVALGHWREVSPAEIATGLRFDPQPR